MHSAKTTADSKQHLAFFLDLEKEDKVFIGPNSLDWSAMVWTDTEELPSSLNKNFYRDELLDFCSNKENSDLHCLLAVLSWGGMRRDHGRDVLQNPVPVLDITHKLRNNIFKSRADAVSYIQEKRSKNLLPGLGIGYFTKLICFFAPALNGYIMDQWVAKAINLIAEDPIVAINKDGWVTDQNKEEVYETFCAEIDKVALLLNTTGYKAEEQLFSIGGHGTKKGAWRQYVIANYQ